MFGVGNTRPVDTGAGGGNDGVFAIAGLGKDLSVRIDSRSDFGTSRRFITTTTRRKIIDQVADPLLDGRIAGIKMPLHAHNFVDLLSEGAL
jgi:hypothetical protein